MKQPFYLDAICHLKSSTERRVVDACQCHSPMQCALGTSARGPGAEGLSPRGSAQGPQPKPEGQQDHGSRSRCVIETAFA